MHFSRSAFALLALPAATLAVTLSDFTPRVTNLQGDCKSIYTETVSGCSPSDFTGSTCSKSCVMGLQALVSPLQAACAGKSIGSNTIIAAFLGGNGPSSLCSNANQVLGAGSSSSAAQSTPATTAATTSNPSQTASSPASSTSSAAITASSSATDSSSTATATTASSTDSASSSSSVATNTNSGILLETSTPSQTSSPTSSSHGSSQTNINDNSGGGSPFDTQGNLASGAAATCGSITAALITTILALAVTLR